MPTDKAALISIPVSTHDTLLAKTELFGEMLEELKVFDSRLTQEDESSDDRLAFRVRDLIRRAEEIK